MDRIVAIIQARMGSTRLPGKVLMDIAGHPVLWHVVRRARGAATIHEVAVATSTNPSDDRIAEVCEGLGVRVVRGHEHDVLDRYCRAAAALGAGAIVRLTADCPLLDPWVIDRVVSAFRTGAFDYVANVNPPTFPDGLDVEILSRHALDRLWTEAWAAEDREHVTRYLRQRPHLFRVGNVAHDADLSALRWTVDEPADLERVRAIYVAMGRDSFGMADVMAMLRRQGAPVASH